MSIEIGMASQISLIVGQDDTATALGSGTAPVLATPRMIALMEEAAWTAIQDGLDEDQTSVGISMNVSHLSATPVGMEITASAEVTAVEGRKISFLLKAWDEKGLIGEGTHQRAIVQEEKFVRKCYEKLEG
ncbi:MAG: thioesterase family protein [Oscillospiraceae bacterium]|nr:thioesterase family protein [Oscillospiraceae bacterium]